jgi:hypothetical protein
VLATVLALVVLTEVIAAVTAILVARGWVGVHPAVVRDHAMWASEQLYVWQFADAIPTLDLTKTLNWKSPPYAFAHAGGALIVFFKLLVLIPIIAAAKELVAEGRKRQSP